MGGSGEISKLRQALAVFGLIAATVFIGLLVIAALISISLILKGIGGGL